MQAYCKGMFPKMTFVNKAGITKMCFKMNFKYYFIKVSSLISKDLFFKPYCYFEYANKALRLN
jgi:hypothetical protein